MTPPTQSHPTPPTPMTPPTQSTATPVITRRDMFAVAALIGLCSGPDPNTLANYETAEKAWQLASARVEADHSSK